MAGGWRYRLASVVGVAAVAVLAVRGAAVPAVQAAYRYLPVVGHLPFSTASGPEFAFEGATAAVVLLFALVPLYKPRPRRILDTAELAVRRVLLGCVALAAIGYFDYSYRLPRATLLVVTGVSLVALPAWFVAIRRRPRVEDGRTLVVGDDAATMADILDVLGGRVIGYLAPPSISPDGAARSRAPATADDGGDRNGLASLPRLGGLSRLDQVLVDHDVDAVVLAFDHPDRGEFFGALDACYEHGVTAKVHRRHADSVLTTGFGSDPIVDVDLEPWDPLDHVAKRAFDVAFAGLGLLLATPLVVPIAIAITLEDDGPILYSQTRTATFGETFTVRKFRTMRTDAEATSGATLSAEDHGGVDPRVTRVGRVLRATHLDELPQLWTILRGGMSVVGPRPERPELDTDLADDAGEWRSRWFVKPGLTGLAQINDVASTDPAEKLRLDVEYIRRQSFWFDLKIVLRQLWLVWTDVRARRVER